jgi:hypothetical protein
LKGRSLDAVAEENASQRLGDVFGSIGRSAKVELRGVVVEGEGGADLRVFAALGGCEVVDGKRDEVTLFVIGGCYAWRVILLASSSSKSCIGKLVPTREVETVRERRGEDEEQRCGQPFDTHRGGEVLLCRQSCANGVLFMKVDRSRTIVSITDGR